MTHRSGEGRHDRRHQPPPRRLRTLLASIAAFAVALVGVLLPVGAASAASADGVTINVSYGGERYGDTTVVEPGRSYTATMQYDTTVVTPGSAVSITVPHGVSISDSALDVPAGNTAIDSVALNGDELVITFQDPLDTSAAQGVYAIEFTFDELEGGSEERDVTWSLGGRETTTTLIVRKPGDVFRPDITDAVDKSVRDVVNLDSHISVDSDGKVTVAPSISSVKIPYSIRVDSADARSGVTITDSITDFLSFDEDSFSATLVTWDENGLNRSEDTLALSPGVSGSTFAITSLDIPASSYLTISYSASVIDTAALESVLQSLADEVDEYEGGEFSTAIVNTAVIDGTEDGATVTVRGTREAAPMPNYGAAFGKSSTPSGELNIELTGDGTLAAPIDVAYTLRADLTQFADFVGGRDALTRNVVISDVLPEQIRWAAEPDFLRVVSGGLELEPVTAGEHDAKSFAADEYVGKYYVKDQQLLINVGQDTSRDHEITAQAQITAVGPNGSQQGDWYRYTGLRNTAVFHYGDGDPASRSVDHPMRVPAPNPADAFAKSSDTTDVVVALDEDGTLAEPVDISYRLRANLTEFADFDGKYFELDRNVVIVDSLPPQLTWAENPLAVVAPEGLVLERVENVDAAAFAGDDYVDSYQVDGQRLMVNVGRDTAASYEFDVRAQLTSVQGLTRHNLPTSGWPKYTETGFTGLVNTAEFRYRDGGPAQSSSVRHRLVVPMDPSQGITDPEVFDKTVSSEPLRARPGQSVEVPYGFTVAANAVPDLAHSRIVDYVDRDVFDLSDLGAVADSITGSYNGHGGLTATSFDLTVDDEGNLVITPSDAFGQELPAAQRPDLTQPLTGSLQLDLTLRTYPLQGKQTLELVNQASLIGGVDDGIVWDGSATGSATSYGNELEVVKSIYTGAGGWTQNLRVELDEGGEPSQREFVYRIELIPHGSYQGVAILPMADVLPDELEYRGFVTNLDTGEVTDSQSVTMGGNVQATWNEANGTVEITQRPGTVFTQGEPVRVDFKVELTEFVENVPVTNTVGNSSATITPTNGYPLLVRKVDSENGAVVIDDRDARFTVTGPDGVITDSAYVVDGRLMVEGAGGTDVGIVVEEPGRYEVTETVPPAGYQLSDATVSVVVDEDGSSSAVTFFNTPEPPQVSVGDLVWVDTDRDGVQDDGEPGIPGVTLVLSGPDGGPVTDAYGDPVGPVVTDEEGLYTFAGLPVLNPGELYTVTIDQAASADALAPYLPTLEGSGDDRGLDSSTWTATSTGLTEDGEHDPTLDFGFVQPMVSVGDLVWLDLDRDGVQDDGEPGIPGVVLTVVGPDGRPVTDVFGAPVGATATDEDGYYTFEGLPALSEGQSYTVRIDRRASAEALARYVPTRAHQGEDRAADSSSWSAVSGNLTDDGDRDPTLDFGFVRAPSSANPDEPTPVDPDEPTPGDPDEPTPGDPDEPTPGNPGGPSPLDPDAPVPGADGVPAPGAPDTSVRGGGLTGGTVPAGEELPSTGADVGRILAAIALVLSLGIAVVAFTRRPRNNRH